MEIIEQKVEKLTEIGIDLVARAARVCYKSEGDKSKNKEFVEGLIKKGHLSPLEFWRTNYLERNDNARRVIEESVLKFDELMNFDCSIFYDNWIAMEITTNIGIARELMRHRVFSYCQESTRYINYKKKKGLQFIPSFDNLDIRAFLFNVEKLYYDTAEHNIKVELVRDILPLCTATTLVMGGFRSDWERMLDLRLNESAGKVHPQMKELAQLIENELNK